MVLEKELHNLFKLLSTDLVEINGESITRYNEQVKVNPLLKREFRQEINNFYNFQINELKINDDMKKCPILYQDNFGVCFAYFKNNSKHYYIGPMSLKLFSDSNLKTYEDYYNIDAPLVSLKAFLISEILDIVELACSLITKKFWSIEDLLSFNTHFIYVKQSHLSSKIDDDIRTEEITQAHHTYNEERYLLNCIKRGSVEEALIAQSILDKSVGQLSTREFSHWKNLAIVAITLATRAAIDGGVQPAIAYKLSDYYIRQCDRQESIEQLKIVKNHAIQELTENVQQNNKILNQSSYIKAAMNYVDHHYQEKLYLKEVAAYIGLSETYFSKLFKKEVGLTFQNYVIQVRLEYAANLLRYSNEPISVISEYVNFPSQSYFGRYFKLRYHMTPKEYRKIYHITG